MIYRFIFLLIFAVLAAIAYSQPGNLVENSSFEERVDCIYNSGAVEQAPPWFNPTDATPDVFHECAVQLEDPCPYPDQVYLDPWFVGVPTNTIGCQEPRSGIGYAGIFFYNPTILGFDFREYLAVPLSETLTSGETYLVQFYVSLAERSMYAVHAFQVLFSPDIISEPLNMGVLNYTPQLSYTNGNYITDKDSWTELSWEYTADGTEHYMYIGNFQTNSVIDTLFAVPDGIDPENHFSSYYYIDDVYVGTEILSLKDQGNFFDWIFWPNPAGGVLNVQTESTFEDLSIYSVHGTEIQTYPVSRSGAFELDVSALAAGSYVLVATDQEGYQSAKHFLKR